MPIQPQNKITSLVKIITPKSLLLGGVFFAALCAIYFTFFFVDYKKDGLPALLVAAIAVYICVILYAFYDFAVSFSRSYKRYNKMGTENFNMMLLEYENIEKRGGISFGESHMFFYESGIFNFLVCLNYNEVEKVKVKVRRFKNNNSAKKPRLDKTLAIEFFDFDGGTYRCTDKDVLKYSNYYLKKARERCLRATV